MIPEEHKNSVISSGLHFMRSITEAYGVEKGMQSWETIADTLDPDLKGEIFFAMLAGTHNNMIIIRGVDPSANAVSCIKEIRNWTGFGLKEAKDAHDLVRSGKSVKIEVKPSEHNNATIGLRKVGMIL